MISIRPKHIAYPPEGGWGDGIIPLEKLRRLGFNDTMIALVRYLPVAFVSPTRSINSRIPISLDSGRCQRKESPKA
ncbi:hypothetical protein COL154_007999 [Colletotrichum chrysophilum]|nr:hypothetical protein KNSL1_007362 [Colletotrichum chrysophilum]KAJ0359799.1 hypothetical protein COL154_007999 [Colletotrichum chrysophilum]